ncbi:hypothetical protein TURU_092436 [Turdus rufiventris]|nr:hypothetical protein TURU_092436 [Turdus rufiventris]
MQTVVQFGCSSAAVGAGGRKLQRAALTWVCLMPSTFPLDASMAPDPGSGPAITNSSRVPTAGYSSWRQQDTVDSPLRDKQGHCLGQVHSTPRSFCLGPKNAGDNEDMSFRVVGVWFTDVKEEAACARLHHQCVI